jgi:hypothetical protein
MRTVSPPLPSSSDASEAETLLDPPVTELPKLLSGDLTPMQVADPNVVFRRAPNLPAAKQMLKLQDFPDCLERPSTFHAVKLMKVRPETDDAKIVRFSCFL